jgi:hypothetical protein
MGSDGNPLMGATIVAGHTQAATDADGRFMLISDTPRYRVTFRERSADGFVSDQRRDTDGTWRASFGLTLA